MLRELGDDRPLDQIDILDLHAIQNRLADTPSFEIHISRTPCRLCVKFVRLLSEISGLPMIICVGTVVTENQAPVVIPKSLREMTQSREEHREELEKFGPVPPEWPADLHRVFAERDGAQRGREATISVELLEMRENHESESPGPEITHISQTPQGTGEEVEPRESRTASEGTASTLDSRESDGEHTIPGGLADPEGDDGDLEEIDGYTYYYWSMRHTPDRPIPSIEEDHHNPRQSARSLTPDTDPDA